MVYEQEKDENAADVHIYKQETHTQTDRQTIVIQNEEEMYVQDMEMNNGRSHRKSDEG